MNSKIIFGITAFILALLILFFVKLIFGIKHNNKNNDSPKGNILLETDDSYFILSESSSKTGVTQSSTGLVSPDVQKIIDELAQQPIGPNASCSKRILVNRKTGETKTIEIQKINKETGQKEIIDCLPVPGFNPYDCKCCERDIYGRRMRYFKGLGGAAYCIPETDSCNENICGSQACAADPTDPRQNQCNKNGMQNTEQNCKTTCLNSCKKLFEAPYFQSTSGLLQSDSQCCPSLQNSKMKTFTGPDNNKYCVREKDRNTCLKACQKLANSSSPVSYDNCINACLIDNCTTTESGKLNKATDICCERDSYNREIRRFNGENGEYCLKMDSLKKTCKSACTKNDGSVDINCQSRCESIFN